jgi:hypothetical protein
MDLSVDGKVTFKWIFKKWGGGGMDWIYLAQDRALVMNLRVP